MADSISLTPDDLYQAAQAFSQVSKESQALVDRLEKATAGLETKWTGVTRQMFYHQYKEWCEYTASLAGLLDGVADEMRSLAEGFEKIDQ